MRIGSLLLHRPFLSHRILAKFSGIISYKSILQGDVECSSTFSFEHTSSASVQGGGILQCNLDDRSGPLFCPSHGEMLLLDENPIKPTLMRRGEALFF